MPETTARATPGHKLPLWRQALFAGGNFGVAFSPTVVSAWLAYFYYGQVDEAGAPRVLVSAGVFGLIWFLANALNGITDPLVGYLSDRTRSRWGRRRPWVVLGAPCLAVSFFFLWTPPTPVESAANIAVLSASLFFFWFFFTVVVAPYLSLLPEITPFDRERVRISALMGAFEVVGTIGGNLAPPLLAALVAGGLGFLGDGYQVMALGAGLALVVLFVLAVAVVPDAYQAPPPTAGAHGGAVRRALREFGSTFRNPAFPPYVIGVGFYRMAIATTVFLAPFIATKVLAAYPLSTAEHGFLATLGAAGEDGGVDWEMAAGYLMMLVLVGAALCFPLVSWLARRLGKRKVFIAALTWLGLVLIAMSTVGLWPWPGPLFQAVALFGLAAFPVAIALVVMRPILADVIDADERLTGLRREGTYNGMEGLIMKVAAGLGPLIAGLLFAWLGAEPGHALGIRLCGPLAGACLLAAAVAFTRYPIRA
jgi:GPH family glycoside/pentoside/hexuronide:cation symporter